MYLCFYVMKGEMDMDKMKELYEKVAGDSVLQNKFTDIMKEAENAGEEETKEKLIAFAEDAGFTVSVEEMTAYFKKLSEAKEGEMSEEELDMVAGGKGRNFWIRTAINMGVGCAVGSAMVFMGDGNCGQIMNKDPFSLG